MPRACFAASAPPGLLLAVRARSRPFSRDWFSKNWVCLEYWLQNEASIGLWSVEASHTPWLG